MTVLFPFLVSKTLKMTNDIFKTAYGKRALMSSKKTLIFLAVVFGIIQ